MAGTNRSGRLSLGDDNFPGGNLPAKPKDLSESEQKVWSHLLDTLPREILRPIDLYQLKILCTLIVRERELAAICRNDPQDHRAGRGHIQTSQQIAKLSTLYGLSSADRRRFKLKATGPTSDADDWQNS